MRKYNRMFFIPFIAVSLLMSACGTEKNETTASTESAQDLQAKYEAYFSEPENIVLGGDSIKRITKTYSSDIGESKILTVEHYGENARMCLTDNGTVYDVLHIDGNFYIHSLTMDGGEWVMLAEDETEEDVGGVFDTILSTDMIKSLLSNEITNVEYVSTEDDVDNVKITLHEVENTVETVQVDETAYELNFTWNGTDVTTYYVYDNEDNYGFWPSVSTASPDFPQELTYQDDDGNDIWQINLDENILYCNDGSLTIPFTKTISDDSNITQNDVKPSSVETEADNEYLVQVDCETGKIVEISREWTDDDITNSVKYELYTCDEIQISLNADPTRVKSDVFFDEFYNIIMMMQGVDTEGEN